jgi:glycosyltransferase involved in cell wall biosynthesis
MATRLGLSDRVQFLGFVTDPECVMAAADCVAVPSTWHEACSRVVVETLAQGTPVVGSNIGGTPELVSDGVEGLLVEVGSVDALVTAFKRIGDHPASRSRLATAARARAERDFRMESVVGKYASVYGEVDPPASGAQGKLA